MQSRQVCRYAIFLLCGALAFGGAPGHADDGAAEHLQKGRAALLKGDADTALEEFAVVLRADQTNAKAWNGHGLAARMKGNQTPMKLPFISLHPAYRQAVKDFEKAIELDPAFAEAYYNRGMMIVSFDPLPTEAVPYFDKTIAANPRFAEAYYERGRVRRYQASHGEKAQYAAAQDDFAKALGIIPDWAAVYFERAQLHHEARHDDLALADYAKAIAQHPRYVEAYRERGKQLYNAGENRAAAADFTKVIELQGGVRPVKFDDDGTYWRAIAYNHDGNARAALDDYLKLIEERPADAFLFYDDAGEMASQLGDLVHALQYYSTSIDKNPKRPKSYLGRGKVYFNQREFDKAAADFTKSLELRPGQTDALLLRGIVLSDKGQVEAALADLNAVVELDPTIATAYYARGATYARRGDAAKAMDDMNKALELNTDYVAARLVRGGLYATSGALDKALADFDYAIKIDPKNAEAYRRRADVYKRKGDTVHAKADTATAAKL